MKLNKRQVDSEVEAWGASLRDRGLRVTAARLAVYRALLETPSHPTADELFDQVRDRVPGLSRATVYNTLETLVEDRRAGLIRIPGEEAMRFDGTTDSHHHFVCSRCGRIEDIHSDRLDRLTAPPGLGSVRGHTVTFTGLCRSCHRRS